MFNSYHAYKIGTDVFLDKVFAFLPSNAFISKGRCGIGGTTLELRNKYRCSIIVVPTVGILIDKKNSTADLFIVYENVTQLEVEKQLSLRLPGQKIMTTPEGMKKIMDAADALRMSESILNEWFLLLDECHTFISEDFRKGILRPFDYFWLFKHKCVISATPYYFSDPRFKQLDYHEITFTERLGTVNLIECKSVFATLDKILNTDQKGNLHIFLNSVTEIYKALQRMALEGIKVGIKVFCADDRDKDNMKKLGEFQYLYCEQPDNKDIAKVNFYTSRYFEGWDLVDDKATIILVSDIYKPHTRLSVGTKLKQAAGRLRKEDPKIIHLTNHRGIYGKVKPLSLIVSEYFVEAAYRLKQHADYLEHNKTNKLKLRVNDDIKLFADIAYKTKEATLNPHKLDQQIYQAYSDEVYNHISLIKEQWENGYFKVVHLTDDHLLSTNTTMKRKSKSEKLKEDYLAILAYKNRIGFWLGSSPEDKIKKTNPLAYKAAKFLTEEVMEGLNYNCIKVEDAVILASNNTAELKLRQLVSAAFKVGDNISIAEIIIRLQKIYDAVGFIDLNTRKIKKAAATDLEHYGWFGINKSKLTMNGKQVNSYQIIRKNFSIRTAA